jgi:hypothetical protein
MGFDDNTQQTPDNREDIPEQTIREVIPAQPEVATFIPERQFVGLRPGTQPGIFIPVYRTVQRKVVLRPAVPEQVIEQEIPGVDFAERNASVVSRLDGNFDVQWATGRSLFTMDLRAGAEYYWNRDEEPLEYNASFATTYLRKLGPRAQFTSNIALSYLSQPDYSQVNLVDSPGASGGTIVGNMKLDLTYRWASRFSTVTSLTLGSIIYEGERSGGNYYEYGLGNEFRYLQSRRLTWVLETRYSQLKYLEAAQGAISTVFLLLGADWTYSRRLRSTIRLGQSLRTYEQGGKASSPYGEVAVYYQPSRREQFNLSARYGFEQTQNASDENIVARLSAGYTRTFTPRLQGSLSVNYVNNQITSAGVETPSTNEVYDGSLLFQYTFNRRFSMNARYSYTLSKTSSGFSDYDRSRFFVTGQYDF